MSNLNFSNKTTLPIEQNFDSVRISIVSPEKIRSWSYGEVQRPDTVNYRTIKPENGGLFCAKIFGPVKNYECLCGKYKRIKYRGIVCEKCGVEVTSSKVRRERMGHIELAAPVVHIWFLKSLPSRISALLDMQLKDVERVMYFESYVVYDPGMSTFNYGQLISEEEYYNAQDTFGEDAFKCGTGAEVIHTMLQELNLQEIRQSLRESLVNTNSETKKRKIVKRLKLVEDFIDSGNKPEWMVLTVLPIMPPDLRPLVMLDGGKFATSDLNELYRRVINRNNRLARLISLGAPDIIVRNEKRMLQESVDALFDNNRKSKSIKNSNKRPYKSLTDMLKGKRGRFRQNLLGKRVDYSGRSVIVVGPELKLHQCGLPKRMALELFRPFVYEKLAKYGISSTLKASKRMVELEKPEVWDVLEDVIKQHPVLLNRAPTLHRLGIQAFEPVLIEGKAIQLHPLVCAAYNADFDGDQMAVHVPLSIKAQLEARVLMMSTNNILSSANGAPVILPSQDIILGLYYITLLMKDECYNDQKLFISVSEVEYALQMGEIKINSVINFRFKYNNYSGGTVYKATRTTAGRVMIYNMLPDNFTGDLSLVNNVLDRKAISSVIDAVYRQCGQKEAVIFADRIKNLGFKWACKAAISIGKDDIVIPKSKSSHIDKTLEEVNRYENQYIDGLITTGEKYNKVIDAWSRCTEDIASDMMDGISAQGQDSNDNEMYTQSINSIYMMSDSGARGSPAQIKQLAGMRGLMTRPSGEIIETPILSNFKEGLTVLEAFASTHGARKGLADTALKTANSGYLTRKLVDVAQDCIVTEHDCGTTEGIILKPIIENGEITTPLRDRIIGRIAASDIHNANGDVLIIKSGEMIDEEVADLIDESGIDSVSVRSVITCKVPGSNVCVKCYGRDLATGKLVNVGEAVGVIAAQSIGEPGTQLTMRTFHIGGAIQKTSIQSNATSSHSGVVKFTHYNTVVNSQQHRIVMSRNCEAVVLDDQSLEKGRYKIPYGAKLLVDDGVAIAAGDKIAMWDPFTIPIITEKSGKISFVDLIPGVSMKEVQDDLTGMSSRVVMNVKHQSGVKQDVKPRLTIVDDKGEIITLGNSLPARYFLPVNAVLNVDDNNDVLAGDIIARIPKESSRSKDITGGLPRVVELFEVRNPKDHSIISDIDGYIEFGKDYKSKRRIIVRSNEDGEKYVEYFVPRGKHVIVNEGDIVSRGDMLMEGSPSLHDILRIMGVKALTEYVVNEVQQVYKLQGVVINDKHIEVILSQMLQKVVITASNGTTMLVGDHVDYQEFNEINEKTKTLGYKPAEGTTILQGITKASLQTKSFLSSASFQETTRVLTEAAVAGKKDMLRGLKENIIVGRLVLGGTGLYANQLKKRAHDMDKDAAMRMKDGMADVLQDAGVDGSSAVVVGNASDGGSANGGGGDGASAAV